MGAQEDRNYQACDLSVHDDDFPEVVVSLVSVVEEAESVESSRSVKLIFFLWHEDVDDQRNTETPENEANQS